MKAFILTLAIIAGLGAMPAMADPNEPTCTGDNCPNPGEDKGR